MFDKEDKSQRAFKIRSQTIAEKEGLQVAAVSGITAIEARVQQADGAKRQKQKHRDGRDFIQYPRYDYGSLYRFLRSGFDDSPRKACRTNSVLDSAMPIIERSCMQAKRYRVLQMRNEHF